MNEQRSLQYRATFWTSCTNLKCDAMTGFMASRGEGARRCLSTQVGRQPLRTHCPDPRPQKLLDLAQQGKRATHADQPVKKRTRTNRRPHAPASTLSAPRTLASHRTLVMFAAGGRLGLVSPRLSPVSPSSPPSGAESSEDTDFSGLRARTRKPRSESWSQPAGAAKHPPGFLGCTLALDLGFF